jgi:hypothetical protein
MCGLAKGATSLAHHVIDAMLKDGLEHAHVIATDATVAFSRRVRKATAIGVYAPFPARCDSINCCSLSSSRSSSSTVGR